MRSRLLAFLSVAVIAVATLVPVEGGSGVPGLCLFCGSRGVADFLSNILLFLPLGWALALRRWSFLATVAVGAAFSLGIELAQFGIVTGRDTSLGDLLANTTGAAAGWVAAQVLWIRLPAPGRPLLAWAWAAAALGMLLVGVWLFEPWAPEGTYHVAWTPGPRGAVPYTGTVLAGSLGSVSLSASGGRVGERGAGRTVLAPGAELAAQVEAGVAPGDVAALALVRDEHWREIMFLAADGRDLLFRHSSRARRIRLNSQQVRFPGLLEGVEAGDTVTIGVSAPPGRRCGRVGTDRECRRAYAAGETWRHLFSPSDWPPVTGTAVTVAWLVVLMTPTGLLAGRRRHLILIAATVVGVLVVVPPLLGLASTPVWHVASALTGLLAGRLLAERFVA